MLLNACRSGRVSDELDRSPLHVVVHVDVGLRRRNAAMPSKRCQYTNADTLAGQRCDERAASAMATSAIDAGIPIQPVKVLAKRVAGEPFPLLRAE